MYNPFFVSDNPTYLEILEALKEWVRITIEKVDNLEELVNELKKLVENLQDNIRDVTKNYLDEMYENGDLKNLLIEVCEEYFTDIQEAIDEEIEVLRTDLNFVKNDNLSNRNGLKVKRLDPDFHNYDESYSSGAIRDFINVAWGYYNNRVDGLGNYLVAYSQSHTPIDKNYTGQRTVTRKNSNNETIWTHSNVFPLDCSSFVQLCMAGVTYDKLDSFAKTYTKHGVANPYNDLPLGLQKYARDNNDEAIPWAFLPMSYGVRNAGELCEMFTLAGLRVNITTGNNYDFSDMEVGDIIFWDKHGIEDNQGDPTIDPRYLGCDHVTICASIRERRETDNVDREDITTVHTMLECTSTNSAYFLRNLLAEGHYDDQRRPENIVAVARPMIRTPQLAKMQEACTQLMLYGVTAETNGDVGIDD